MSVDRKIGGSKVAKEMEKAGAYNVLEEGTVGEVQIADEVVAIIAGLAATEVEGVASINPEDVVVDMALNMEYGYNIPKTSETVQDRVKNAIENMTGLHVAEVNIRIAGVAI